MNPSYELKTSDVGVREYFKCKEDILYVYHLHWIILIPASVYVMIGCIFGVYVIIPLIWLMIKVIEYIFTEVIITHKRVIIKRGWLYLRLNEIEFPKVETIVVYKSFLGLILNYGNVNVVGSGGTNNEVLCLSTPLDFSSKLQLR